MVVATSLLVRFNDKKADYTPPTFISDSENHNKAILLADKTFIAGNFGEALALYKRVLAAYPENYPLLNKIGQIHVKLKQLQEAKAIYNKLCKKSPDNVDFQTSMAFVSMELRDYDKAMEHAEKAISLIPVDGLPYLIKAAVFAHRGDTGNTLATFKNIRPTGFLVNFLKSSHFDNIRKNEAFKKYQFIINQNFGNSSNE